MADYHSAERKRRLEESISKLRADALKELDDMAAEYKADFEQQWGDTFQILEDINNPDHHGKATFEAMVAANKKVMKDASDAVIAALDAMEKDMRADHAKFEQRVREDGEPSEGHVLMMKSYTVRDYYHGPAM